MISDRCAVKIERVIDPLTSDLHTALYVTVSEAELFQMLCTDSAFSLYRSP